MKELIKKLSDLRGISGFEYRISDKIKDFFAPYADEVYKDKLQNVIAVKKCGKDNAPKIMIEAHIDEIGLMVSGIDENGFISFVPVGGVDKRILPASEVVVHGTKDLKGVIGAKPPHLQNPGEQNKSAEMSDMAIDVGMGADSVREFVSVGDSVTFAQSVGEMGGQFSGKTLDDRAGVAAIITVMKNLERLKLDVDVYAVAAVQEEVGLRGAKTSAYGICPDMAVSIDVCHGITPDNSKNAFQVGEGVVISIGPNIHPKMFERLKKTAQEHHLKVQYDVDGGDTGTDAWAIQVSRMGVPAALLSIPLKYMHTSVETLCVSDVEMTADLLTFFIHNIGDDTEEWLCL